MHASNPQSLSARFRAFFTSRLSARWFAHLALVEVLIFSLVVLPCVSVRAGFADSAGNYDIWTEGGRAGHWFAIQEATDINSPVHFNSGSLWLPGWGGGNRIHGNYNSAGVPNGMIIRDLTTNEVAPLPDDGNGVVQIAPGSWAPADGSAARRVYFTIDPSRAEHSLQLIQSNGTVFDVTVDTNSVIWGGFGGDLNTPWPPQSWWESQTLTASALFDPSLPFRIVDLSTGEQSAENETNIALQNVWEPIPSPLPVEEVRVVLPSFAANQNFTVHTQVPWGPTTQAAVTAQPSGYRSGWAINTATYYWSAECAVITFTAPVSASFWITHAGGGRWPGGDGTHPVPDNSLSMYDFDALDFPPLPPPPTVAVTLRINAESFSDPATYGTDNLANHHWQLWTTAGMIAEANPPMGATTFITGSEYVSTHAGQAIDNPISVLTLTAQVPEGVDWWVVDYARAQTHPIRQAEFMNGWTPHIPLPTVLSSWDIHSQRLTPQGYYPGYISIGIAPTSFQTTFDRASVLWISGSMVNGGTPAGTVTEYEREFFNENTYEYYTLPYTHLEYNVPGEWGSSYLLVIQHDLYAGYYQNYVGQEIALSVGATDDTTWLPAEEPIYLSISESRWGHDLVLRHVDGREYPIRPGQTQGDTSWSSPMNLQAWQNSYFYFDANTQATPGLAWYVVDKTVGDSAGYGETNLIDWVLLVAPEITSFGENGFDSVNASIMSPITQNVAFKLERSINGLPWSTIGSTEVNVRYPYTSTWLQYQGPMFPETHRIRAKAVYGTRSSAYSQVMTATLVPLDSDGDGLGNLWEIAAEMNPYDASDFDFLFFDTGVTAQQTYQANRQPGGRHVSPRDADGDGIPNDGDAYPLDARRSKILPKLQYVWVDISGRSHPDASITNVALDDSGDLTYTWFTANVVNFGSLNFRAAQQITPLIRSLPLDGYARNSWFKAMPSVLPYGSAGLLNLDWVSGVWQYLLIGKNSSAEPSVNNVLVNAKGDGGIGVSMAYDYYASVMSAHYLYSDGVIHNPNPNSHDIFFAQGWERFAHRWSIGEPLPVITFPFFSTDEDGNQQDTESPVFQGASYRALMDVSREGHVVYSDGEVYSYDERIFDGELSFEFIGMSPSGNVLAKGFAWDGELFYFNPISQGLLINDRSEILGYDAFSKLLWLSGGVAGDFYAAIPQGYEQHVQFASGQERLSSNPYGDLAFNAEIADVFPDGTSRMRSGTVLWRRARTGREAELIEIQLPEDDAYYFGGHKCMTDDGVIAAFRFVNGVQHCGLLLPVELVDSTDDALDNGNDVQIIPKTSATDENIKSVAWIEPHRLHNTDPDMPWLVLRFRGTEQMGLHIRWKLKVKYNRPNGRVLTEDTVTVPAANEVPNDWVTEPLTGAVKIWGSTGWINAILQDGYFGDDATLTYQLLNANNSVGS